MTLQEKEEDEDQDPYENLKEDSAEDAPNAFQQVLQ